MVMIKMHWALSCHLSSYSARDRARDGARIGTPSPLIIIIDKKASNFKWMLYQPMHIE